MVSDDVFSAARSRAGQGATATPLVARTGGDLRPFRLSGYAGFMEQPDWERFVTLTRESPPWPLLMRAVDLVPRRGRALDLGPGAGRDTRYLLARGFQVTAVDASAHAVSALSSLDAEHLRVVQAAFEDFAFDTYDLINAQYSLPFVSPRRFRGLFTRLKRALAPGGVFTGQFFGRRDQWNTPGRPMTFLSREQAESLLRDLALVEFAEEETDGHLADGSPKHWHAFHIIARKKPGYDLNNVGVLG